MTSARQGHQLPAPLPPQDQRPRRQKAASSGSTATAQHLLAFQLRLLRHRQQQYLRRKTSTAAEIKKAKEYIQSERGRSENTLHAVGRLMSNESLLSQMRRICLATTPIGIKYGMAYKTMRGIQETLEWYSGWACWYSGSINEPPCVVA